MLAQSAAPGLAPRAAAFPAAAKVAGSNESAPRIVSRHALRPYQIRAIELLDEAIASGSRAPLLVCPTGSGKTVIATALIGRVVERGERALFLAPRRERLAFYLELRGLGIERNWKDSAVACQYKERFGAWPPRSWNQMAPAQPSIETRRWVQSRLIAWRKTRAGVAA